MRKFIFSLILGAFMSVELHAQSIQIPTIHVVEFNLDTLKHEINDSVLYYNRLKELKGQLKQEKQEVKRTLIMQCAVIKASEMLQQNWPSQPASSRVCPWHTRLSFPVSP